jgi:hypothetical protein
MSSPDRDGATDNELISRDARLDGDRSLADFSFYCSERNPCSTLGGNHYASIKVTLLTSAR